MYFLGNDFLKKIHLVQSTRCESCFLNFFDKGRKKDEPKVESK